MLLCWQCCSFLEVLWWNFFRSLMYNITPANRNNFPTCIHLVFSFFLSAPAMLQVLYWKQVVLMAALSCSFTSFKWDCSQFFSIYDDVGSQFVNIPFTVLRYASSSAILFHVKLLPWRHFWILPKALFSVFWDDHVIFVCKSIYMVFCIY